MAEEEKTKKSSGMGIVIALITIFLVLATVFCLAIFLPPYLSAKKQYEANLDGLTTPLSRSATNGDVDIDISNDFSLSVDIIVTPKTDIKNLQLTLYFMDKNNNVLTTRNNTLGNVKKSTQYSIVYRISEFSFEQIFKLVGVRIHVSGGTVSYFA